MRFVKLISIELPMKDILKSTKHLENIQQNKVNNPRKNLKRRVVKEENKVSDIDTKVEKQYYFTDKIFNVAYDITVDNHHDTC